MSEHVALYRKYRPKTFNEVLGQKHVIGVIHKQLVENKTSHAYLFSGTRGTGKTTMARLFAAGVNCTSPDIEGRPCGICENCKSIQSGTFLDVIELDAASNRGIDDARELRSKMIYPPTIGRKKIFIIDEAHQLTKEASNALLKTLEEPPEYIIFILATTEPEKLLQTIKSRCLKLDFERISNDEIEKDLKRITENEGFKISDDALKLLSEEARGSARDGLSVLEKVLASSNKDEEITREKASSIIGIQNLESSIKLLEYIVLKKMKEAILLVDDLIKTGINEGTILEKLIENIRSLIFLKSIEDIRNNPELLSITNEQRDTLLSFADKITNIDAKNLLIKYNEALSNMKYSENKRILLDIAILV